MQTIITTLGTEIRPRARRRVRSTVARVAFIGNTSACAEKSTQLACRIQSVGKYLRVRGEEVTRRRTTRVSLEIPPRARRRVINPDKNLR